VLTDLDEEALAGYRSAQTLPADFDAFWADTLHAARERGRAPVAVPVESALRALRVWDVTFSGFDGQPVRAWLRMPAAGAVSDTVVVEYAGYGGGRGRPEEGLFWASAGFAHLQMDTRGQGASWSIGATADDAATGPSVPGFMTRGIQSPETFYYRRLITDAVLAVDAVRALPEVEQTRVAVTGFSQGGGLTLAAAALADDLLAAFAFVPFLTDFPRALRITDNDPYREIGRYLATRRDEQAQVERTLAYVDGVNFARRARTPLHLSAALMDPVCPPSTVYGAFHEIPGERSITLWPWNGHEGGALQDQLRAAEVLRAL
jgi:cephalosporin-C deacetylase